MSTFKELQQQLIAAKSKSKIYQHLIDHLEASFRPVSGAVAKKVLLGEDKIPIADEHFEQVVKELYGGMENVKKTVDQIEAAPIAPTPPNPLVPPPGVQPVNITGAPAPAPVPAPVPVVAPKSEKSKSTTQGEVQS